MVQIKVTRVNLEFFLVEFPLFFLAVSAEFVLEIEEYIRELIYLFGVLRCFHHWKGRGNQYIQFIRVLYCKLPTNAKQLPAFPLEAMPGTEPWPQRWEAKVLLLCHRGPLYQQTESY